MGADIKPLHFRNIVAERPECAASGRLGAIPQQIQAAQWFAVFSGQSQEFFIKMLKAQIQSSAVGLFPKQLSHQINLGRVAGGDYLCLSHLRSDIDALDFHGGNFILPCVRMRDASAKLKRICQNSVHLI